MPTFKKRKTSKGLFSEDDLKNAVADVKSKSVSIRKAALKHNVDRSTLQRYVKKFGDQEVHKHSMVTKQVSR